MTPTRKIAMKQRHCYFSEDMDKKLMARAADERRPIAFVVREAVAQYLKTEIR